MRLILAVCVLVLGLASCGQKANQESADLANASSPPSPMMPKEPMRVASPAQDEVAEASQVETKRYLAVRHDLIVETPAAEVKAQFEAAVKHCESMKCQMLNASFSSETQYNPASASLSVRVPPLKFNEFLNGVEKSTHVLQHQRESEDKTDAVIDTEARLKNLTELRDRLRKMLAEQPAKIKDILDIEVQLTETQSQIDRATGMRKALSNETDWVAIDIQFQAINSVTEKGFFAPVAEALSNAGRVMMSSVASIITFFVTILPWLLFGIPVLLLGRKAWRKLRAK